MEHVSDPLAKLLAGVIKRSKLDPQQCLRMFDQTKSLRWLVQYELEAEKQQLEANKEPVK